MPAPIREEHPLDEAVEKTAALCNVVRRCDGEVEIEDLVAGIRHDAHECVVARSVNCGLTVRPIAQEALPGFNADRTDSSIGWYRGPLPEKEAITNLWCLRGSFDHAKLLRVVADETGLPIVDALGGGPVLILPYYAAQVAEAFDSGQLEQYDSSKEAA